MSEIKSLAEMVHEFGEKSEEEKTPEEKKIESIRLLPDDEKYARAFDMRMQGLTAMNIATVFGVSPQTITSWLSKHAQNYRMHLEQEPAANIVAESILFLRKIEEVCLYEASQFDSDSIVVDSIGIVTRNKNYKSADLKMKYLLAGLKSREMMLNLMIKTGVLPTEPERMYHLLSDSKKAVLEDSGSHKSRSKEEIAENVLKLLEKSTTL